MRLDITTPERMLVSTEVESIEIPGKNGYLGILPQHATLISELRAGPMEYKTGGRTERVAISGGYLEVLPQQVTVLAETAEKAAEIDVPRAEPAKKRAEDRLKSAGKDVDLDRAMCALERSMARLMTAKK
jgi:F-type H+-transporting ATPase subunit epsilon